jgi:hypothetical protein
MAVFVVHGYTVLAMSLAPISGRTLALGSADGKQTVCAQPDAVEHAMGVAKLLGCAAQWPLTQSVAWTAHRGAAAMCSATVGCTLAALLILQPATSHRQRCGWA